MGEPLIEQLQKMGMPVAPFTMTAPTKKALIEELALGFEQGTIRIINDPTLIGELQAYEMTRTPSGMLRYSAPSGMHDDCVVALALAWGAAMVDTERSDIFYMPQRIGVNW